MKAVEEPAETVWPEIIKLDPGTTVKLPTIIPPLEARTMDWPAKRSGPARVLEDEPVPPPDGRAYTLLKTPPEDVKGNSTWPATVAWLPAGMVKPAIGAPCVLPFPGIFVEAGGSEAAPAAELIGDPT